MKAIDKAKSFLKKYRHAWVLSYFLIYMPWFVYLEKRTNVRINGDFTDYVLFYFQV